MRLVYLLLLLISSYATAQVVTDGFSDGNFTANPTWLGDNNEFIVNPSLQLQLNNTVSGTSYLSTPSPTASLNNIEWEFYIKESFSPSSSNYGRVYLASDQANLEGSLNGYYLQFGESGSSDAVELFRQSGSTSTSVARGTDSLIASSFAIGVKVTRNASGTWNLYVDPAGGTAYTLQASGTDNIYTTTNYFGVAAVYTSSNATKFYFDDFYNGPVVVDATPPSIASATALTSTTLDVLFSENVDLITSQTATNYSVNNGIGISVSAIRDATNLSLVHLTFTNAFTNGIFNTLTVTNVQDLNTNALTSATTTFTYYQVQPYDIVINEIMADPDPVVALPNFEYLELYNRTAFAVNLTNWKLVIGTTTKVLPDITIAADSFLVITSSAALPEFGSSIAIVGLSSLSLTNSGQTVTLKTANDGIVSTVSYTDGWYQNSSKASGGWSIEQVDPDNPCAGMSNWRASVEVNGGTPGKQNSVNASNPDNTLPQLLRVSIIANDTIQLYFDEPLDSTTMLSASIYTIDNGIGNPVLIQPIAPDFKSIRLALATALQVGIIYHITINNSITDCVGNTIGADNTSRFAIPETAVPNDVVVNEILSDPKTGGVDFVEIYNRSNKVIDLKTMTVSQYDTVNNVLISIENISTEGYLLFPQDYLVLSEDGAVVRSQYATINPKSFLDMDNLPSMNISDGTVCLATAADIIDLFKYDENMQYALLNSSKGVSLERIDFNRPTQDRTNWHSAAASIGYATPAYKNSQYNNAGETGNSVEVIPEVFSPDEDGVNDVVNINYNFNTPGFVANVTVYDGKGRIVKHLVRSELLGAKGTFSWDGVSDDKEKARMGIYILFVEAFDLSGTVKQYKKTCVLGGKL